MTVELLDPELIASIRMIEKASGRSDVLSGLVGKLEVSIAGFAKAFRDCLVHGDTAGAARAAHTLKGSAHQLGAQALGDLFADIERAAKAGDYDGAQRKFHDAGPLIARSFDALRRA
jgi:HPt (histidine-containing phosphotransfer) domain-containing protein